MAATPILTQGITMTIDNSGGTPVTINGHRSISGLGSGEAGEIDVTTLASTAKEFMMGLQDNGSFTVSFIWNLDDSGQAELMTARAAQSQRTFILTLPSSTNNVGTMEVFVLSYGPTSIDPDGVVMGEAKFRVTGAISWA
jgi:hypothetical protein